MVAKAKTHTHTHSFQNKAVSKAGTHEEEEEEEDRRQERRQEARQSDRSDRQFLLLLIPVRVSPDSLFPVILLTVVVDNVLLTGEA